MMELLEWVKSLHQSETFVMWLSQGGIYIVTAIIFAETGLLAGFFLPGDSLLITVGVLTNPLNPNYLPGTSVLSFAIVLSIAAIIGDQLGYFLGRKAGQLVFEKADGVFFKKKYLTKAHDFYERYGVAAIIACRFVPIMRTFVPFIAGVAKMNYSKFLRFDILGGLIWINSLLAIGYFLGQTELANRLDKVILVVIFVSILPMVIGGIRQIMKGKANESI